MTKSVKPTARATAPRSLRAYLTGPPRVGQRTLAEAAGCNQSMISMLLRGKRVPSARLAVTLHTITKVPLKTLLATRLGTAPSRRRRRPAPRGDPRRPLLSL